MYLFPLVTYDGLDLGYVEVSTDGIIDSNLEVFLLGVLLGSVDGINLSFKEVTEILF